MEGIRSQKALIKIIIFTVAVATEVVAASLG